jgi:acyl-coenzyme A synthetase/AMP-(fatty) acid ligase
MARLPLIHTRGPDAPFAYQCGRVLSARHFLGDVARLAEVLPAGSHVLNLCNDRYRFTVGFAAALLRGQVNLLPPNQTADLMAQLCGRYPGVYALVDNTVAQCAYRTFQFPALEARNPPTTDIPVVDAAQLAALVFTSGSTGEPVANAKSWGSLAAGARAELDRFGLVHSPTAILATVPPQHMYGLESSVVMAMQGGLALHAGRPLFPADVCAALESLPRPRALVTTPVHLRALLAESGAAPAVDLLICATAPLGTQMAVQAQELFGAPLQEIYGCTEAGQIATRTPAQNPEWHALNDLALRQDEKGTWVRGGHVDGEVLLHDVIELRGRDRFLLHGRNADLVNIAGKRTSLAHLNHHLNSIDGVRDGVFIAPDESDAVVARLIAFVVAPGIDYETVMAALRSRIDAAFLPRPLYLVDALPRNATGKLPRAALDALAGELVAREE